MKKKKLGLKLLVLIVAIAMITVGIIYGRDLILLVYSIVSPPPNVCTDNQHCQWKITNCCSENSGAKWECVNIRSYKQLDCPSVVICPQVLSPKPSQLCVCETGNCVVK